MRLGHFETPSTRYQGHVTVWKVRVVEHGEVSVWLIMAALRSRCGHYIFALWFLSSIYLLFYSSPYLSGNRLDVYHTSTHGVALVRI